MAYLPTPRFLHRLLEYLFTVSGFNEMIDRLLVNEFRNKYLLHDADFKFKIKSKAYLFIWSSSRN